MPMTHLPFNMRMPPWGFPIGRSLILLGAFLLGIGCQQPKPKVQSYLEGRITVSAEIDTSTDYSDFRVLVVRAEGRRLDTLGYATTDRDGRFSMTVSAPKRDIYSLAVWGREGRERLVTTSYVVAAGDSGTLDLEFPVRQRPIRVESPENLALLGFRNTLTMHQRMMRRRLQPQANQTNALVQNVRQTSSILWSLGENYSGTYAGQLAAVESLSLLEGWNDSLVIARAQHIAPANPRFVDAARITRNAVARLHGHEAALDTLNSLQVQAKTDQQRAGIKAIRIQAFLDSMQTEAALSAAQKLKAEHPHTEWAEWADRAQYQARNLMPGMTAPNFAAQTIEGDSLSLQALRGHPVVLEYFRPGNDTYTRQLNARNALYEDTRSDSVAFVSISTTPDSLVNRTFLNNESPPGHQIIAPGGSDDPLVTRYNVVNVPTRFLIAADGTLVGQYQDSAFLALRLDLTRLLNPGPASSE